MRTRASASHSCEIRRLDISLTPPRKFGDIVLLQLADILAHPGWFATPHIQFCHEIVLILEGDAEMTDNTSRFTLHAGQLAVIPEGKIHDVRYAGSVPTRMLLAGVHLHEEIDPLIKRVFRSLSDSDVRVFTAPAAIRTYFEALIYEYFSPEAGSPSIIQSLLLVLTMQVCRQINAAASVPADYPPIVNDPDDPLTLHLCQYIRDHALDIPSLSALPGVFSYSYSYLSHYFSRKSGYSLKAYWEHYRFAHIIDLMRNTNLTLTQIAERAHYHSIHAFSRSFRKRFGVSPSEYRRLSVEGIPS